VPFVYPDEIKTKMARYLLDLYRDEARLVITTKLHCALPCIAFGVPVIFFGDPHSYRLSLLRDLSVMIYRPPSMISSYLYQIIRKLKWAFHENPKLKRLAIFLADLARKTMINRKVNWDPQVYSFEDEKVRMVEKVRTMIQTRTEESR
jgi:hypothetical protein